MAPPTHQSITPHKTSTDRQAGLARLLAARANWALVLSIVFAALALLGWLIDVPLLHAWISDWPVMRPTTALCVLGSALAFQFQQRGGTGRRKIAVLLNIVIAAALISALLDPPVADGLFKDAVPAYSAVLLVMLQPAITLSAWADARARRYVRISVVAIAALAFAGLLGVSFRLLMAMPALVELSLPGGASLLLLCYAVLFGRSDSWLTVQLSSDRAGPILIRRLLPVVFIFPIALALLHMLAQREGWVDTPSGVLLITVCTILGFSTFVLHLARLLDHVEAQRERAQREVDAQREWLRVTLTSIDDAVIAADPNYVVQVMNPAAERLTGIPARDLVGYSLAGRIVLLNAEGAAVDCPLRAILNEGDKINEGEFTLCWDDGRKIPIEVSVMPIQTGDSGFLGGVMVMRDVSARRRNEQSLRDAYNELDRRVAERTAALQHANAALHETLALFRGVAESTPDLIYVKDLEGRLVMANPATARAFARPEVELLGKGDSELIDDPVLAQRAVEHDQRVLSSGQVERAEQILRTPEGPRTFLATKSPLRDVQGNIVGLISVATDISERKRMENDLREAQRFTQGLLDTAPLILYLLDLGRGRVVFASGMVLSALGYSTEEFLSMHSRALVELIHPDDHATLKEHLKSYRTAPEGPKTFELRFRHRSGEWRWLHCRERLFDAAGSSRLTLGVAVDVTDRRQAEHELEQLITVEKRLRHEAERANRAKDEFLAIVSHELRSPLNALRGWSFLLGNSRPVDPVLLERAVQAIKRNVDHQARLIDDLLDTSRIMSGKLTLERRPVNLVEIVHSALDVVRPAASAKRINVGFVPDHPSVSVDGDAARLHQIVVNLLTNAVKFTPEEGSINIAARVVDDRAHVVVQDTGVGIESDFLPHVFERFSQADTSTTRKHGGLGIGLALVRHLAEMHGGRVSVASAGRNQGSTFTVDLPLPSAMRAHAESATAAFPISLDGAALQGLIICALDDDPDARDIINVTLRRAGASVHSASSGADLIALLDEMLPGQRPDVLLLDLAMPGEDGFSVLLQVRALEARKGLAIASGIPAIAVTAFTDLNRTLVIEKGFIEHVAKPFDPGKLVATIKRVTATHQAQST